MESKRARAQAADARGRIFGKLAKEIMVAARGGADPASNARLRLVVEQARKVSMPKDTLERAIRKGAGIGGDAAHFEHVMYEGFAPHQVAVMVECLTDNVKRTAPEMRVLFRKASSAHRVRWHGISSMSGLIEAEPEKPGPDADPEVAAIEAGAQDFEPGEDAGTTLFVTEPADLDAVGKALHPQGFTVLSARLGYRPKIRSIRLRSAQRNWKEVEAFLAAIDANDDVQHVYVGLSG